MDIINGFKSSIKENESELNDYVRKRNSFQKELREILLKRDVVEGLKMEREIGGKN
jgi:hypothetical protein